MELDLAALDSLEDAALDAILQAWTAFYASADALLAGDVSADPDLANSVRALCARGLGPLVQDHFLSVLEETFKRNAVLKFWKHFDSPLDANILERHKPYRHWSEEVLMKSLEEISAKKAYQEKCLRSMICSLQSHMERKDDHCLDTDGSYLLSKYQLIVSSVLLTTLPSHFPGVLRSYFSKQLDDLNKLMTGESEEGEETQYHETLYFEKDISPSGAEMDVDVNHNPVISRNHTLIKKIGRAVHYLRNLGFTSLTEDAYASAIFLLLKTKVYSLAGDDYRIPVLQSIKEWIQVVPLQFLHALLAYLGDTVDDATASPCFVSPLASETLCLPWITKPSEVLVRWQLRLEYFAYETLQDLRIAKLFEIIVDYPESSPAIDDLRRCLDYTGQHSKLVDSFISSLRCRLLTAGASTNDILHQYVSTIKALRTIDPTGVFLEAVGEPIRDYLRGRKDTIKCIVTMLTEGSGGNAGGSGNTGDSLLEELNRDTENKESSNYDDNLEADDKQAWLNAERWEPDRVEAGPFQGGSDRRKIDILGMLVSVIGSKDQLVNEYRVMLAEKLVSKSDYDIDSEIRTVELLKIHFGESSMQKCEIMISDLIGSKRINTNIKASMPQSSKPLVENEDNKVSLDLLDATIISSHFWPPIQAESINIPTGMDQLLSDYAKRFHEIKTPRKLIWLKNLGTVKIELQFGGKKLQFAVSPVHAAIIMKFQDQMCWTSKDLADAVGLSVDALNRRITFWISKGILAESPGVGCDNHIFTIVEETNDMNRSAVGSGYCEDLSTTEEEGERSVVSVEEQLQKEMTIYEKFIIGMLTNFGNLGLDRIHNTLKMFCIAEPSYDKSLQQLQSFLSGLVSEEKLDIRDGLYFLKK